MLENIYEGLNPRSEVYLSNDYFCKMYPTYVSSKLCEFIVSLFSKVFFCDVYWEIQSMFYLWKHIKREFPASRQQSADLDNNTISVKTLGC